MISNVSQTHPCNFVIAILIGLEKNMSISLTVRSALLTPHQYFPPGYVALMLADISYSTILSVLVFFLGRVSDGSGEGLLKLLREFACET